MTSCWTVLAPSMPLQTLWPPWLTCCAGTLVDVSGKRNVTMKSDAILRADDGERYDADGGHPPHCR
ncbi:MAG UNVERIFIED_CONTAM: hypothetical protein LVR18_51575 [Planctomycetaceae bacterium]